MFVLRLRQWTGFLVPFIMAICCAVPGVTVGTALGRRPHYMNEPYSQKRSISSHLAFEPDVFHRLVGTSTDSALVQQVVQIGTAILNKAADLDVRKVIPLGTGPDC